MLVGFDKILTFQVIVELGDARDDLRDIECDIDAARFLRRVERY